MSTFLVNIAQEYGLPAWLLPALLHIEQSWVGRMGPGGINVRTREYLQAAANGTRPTELGTAQTVQPAEQVRLTRIELTRYRQYRAALIDFDAPPARPIVLIEGQNGYGKSSLVEALQFALMDHATKNLPDRLHADLEPNVTTTNLCVQVGLRSSRDGAITIKRQVEFRRKARGAWVPHGKVAFTVTADTLTRPVQHREAQDWISQRFPADVLQYFIFDAESAIVAKLSGQAGERLPQVRAQVESALGIQLIRDIAKRCRDRVRAWRKDLPETVTPTDTLRSQQQHLDAQIESIQADLDAALDRRAPLLESMTATADALAAHERHDTQIEEHSAQEARLTRLTADLRAARAAAVEALSEALPLALLGAALHVDAGERWRADEASGARRAIAQIAHAVAHGALPWARSSDAPKVARELTALVGLSESALPSELHRRIEQARRQLPDTAQVTTLRQAPAEIARLELSLARSVARGDGRLTADIGVLRTQNDEVSARLRALDEQIGRLKGDLARAQGEHGEVEASLAQAGDSDAETARLSSYIQIADAAVVAFGAAAEQLLAQRLDKMQTAATRALRAMVHKADLYDRIVINPDSLRYQILDSKGRPVPAGRSQGERTVLALALVQGLREASGLQFPLFIEAPLKTLDPVHQDRVSREFLSRFDGQVVLLVKPEELDMSDRLIRARVGQYFRLTRESMGREDTRVHPVEQS